MNLIFVFQLCQYFKNTLETLKHKNFSKSDAIALIEKKKKKRSTVASSSTDFRIRKKVLETHVIVQFEK